MQDHWLVVTEAERQKLASHGIDSLFSLCNESPEDLKLILGDVLYRQIRMKLRNAGIRLRPPQPTAIDKNIASFADLYEAGITMREIAQIQGVSKTTAYNREKAYKRILLEQKRFNGWKDQMRMWRGVQRPTTE